MTVRGLDHSPNGGSVTPKRTLGNLYRTSVSDGTAPNPQVKCFYLYKIKNQKYTDYMDGKVPKVYCQP
jgi:hypothetical protein